MTIPTGLRILCVDDDESQRQVFVAYLKDHASVTLAESGEKAINLYHSEIFDVVLLDINMPEMDGYATVNRFREIETARGTQKGPVIAITGYNSPDDVAKALEAGCDAHLSKPITKVELLGAIERALAEHTHVKVTPSNTVHLDPALLELIPDYLKSRKEDLIAIRDAVVSGNFAAVIRVAHQIKGNALNFGFRKLYQIAQNLEHAAKESQKPTVEKMLYQMEGFVKEVSEKYGRK